MLTVMRGRQLARHCIWKKECDTQEVYNLDRDAHRVLCFCCKTEKKLAVATVQQRAVNSHYQDNLDWMFI